MMYRSSVLELVIVLCALSTANSSVCAPPQTLQAKLQARPRAETYAEVGIWYSEHRQYSCAVAAYEAAAKMEPKSAQYLYLLGLNLLRNGDVKGAVRPLQQSIEIDPEVPKPHLLLATALEELHRGEEARTEWMAALRLDPRSRVALEGVSKNLLAAHEFDALISLLGPEPRGEDMILNLATAYDGTGNADQAIETLKRGLQENPTSVALARALISDLALQTRFQEATKLSEKLVQQHPGDLEAKVLYLHVLVLQDDEDRGRPLAKKLLSMAPRNFSVLYLNGLLENSSGNYSAGRSFLERAVALNPNQYNSHYHLGVALANLNDPQGARKQFEQALALGAREPRVRFEYAKVLRTLGETELASEQLKLYKEAEEAEASRTQAIISLGQGDKELAAGNPKKAIESYRDAIAALPDYALLQYKLSFALDKVGDTIGEREALQKAIQIDPTMAIAHRQLGYLAFNEGDFPTAETHFRAAVQAAPTFTDAWVSLAATLATESRHTEANQAVRRALKIDPQNANALELQKELADAAAAQPQQ
jgi:Flp pilus assembly protein TadD